jgi:hypothetical protein
VPGPEEKLEFLIEVNDMASNKFSAVAAVAAYQVGALNGEFGLVAMFDAFNLHCALADLWDAAAGLPLDLEWPDGDA